MAELSDALFQLVRDEISGAVAETKALRIELQKESNKIVGWDKFEKYKSEVAEEFKCVKSDIAHISQLCTELKTEQPHLLPVAVGVSKVDFDSAINGIMLRIDALEKSNFATTFTWCHVKEFFGLRWVQAFFGPIGLMIVDTWANTTAGRLGDAGYIAHNQIVPTSFGLVIVIALVFIYAVKKDGKKKT